MCLTDVKTYRMAAARHQPRSLRGTWIRLDARCGLSSARFFSSVISQTRLIISRPAPQAGAHLAFGNFIAMQKPYRPGGAHNAAGNLDLFSHCVSFALGAVLPSLVLCPRTVRELSAVRPRTD